MEPETRVMDTSDLNCAIYYARLIITESMRSVLRTDFYLVPETQNWRTDCKFSNPQAIYSCRDTLKCAVNPSGPCDGCKDFEERPKELVLRHSRFPIETDV